MSKARQLADLGNQIDDGAITGSNMVVNGAMTVAQRGVSFTGLTNTSFTLDRFEWQTSTGPTVTIEQSTDAPVGFYNSLKVTVTTTDTMAAGDYDAIHQPIEGLNFSHLGFGASGAKQFTLSFWAKASVTGAYSVNLINSANDRTWTGSYSINTASTWEYKTIVVDGDTSGTWLATNGLGLKVWFSLGSGSTYQAASTSSAWSSGLNLGLTGAVDLRTASGATFQITGVCLNVGDSAIAFPHESYGDTLAKCQRYFEKIELPFSVSATGHTSRYGSGIWSGFTVPFQVPKRAQPAVSEAASSVLWRRASRPQASATDIGSGSYSYRTQYGVSVFVSESGRSNGEECVLFVTAGDYIEVEAEL